MRETELVKEIDFGALLFLSVGVVAGTVAWEELEGERGRGRGGCGYNGTVE